MTVSNTTSVVQYNGNGVTVAWPTGFRFFKNTDLVVTKRSASGTTTLLTLNTDYSVSGANALGGGTVTTTNALLGGSNPELLTIARVLTVQQLTDLRNQGNYFAEIHEDVFDYLTMLIQQTGESDSRALRHPRDSEHYQAEGRRIVNLEDPQDYQDAATKYWVQAEVGRALGQGQGPANFAQNVSYINGDGALTNLQNGTIRQFSTVKSIFGASGSIGGEQASLTSYHGGTYIGDSHLVWAPSVLKSKHDGFRIFSPTVPTAAISQSQASIISYMNRTGETDASGSGCWLRLFSGPVRLEYAGVTAGFDCGLVAQKVIDACVPDGLAIDCNVTLSTSTTLTLPEYRTTPAVQRDLNRTPVTIRHMKPTMSSGVAFAVNSQIARLTIGWLEGPGFTGSPLVGIKLFGQGGNLITVAQISGFQNGIEFNQSYSNAASLGWIDDCIRGIAFINSNANRILSGHIGGRYSTGLAPIGPVDPTTCEIGISVDASSANNIINATVEYCRRSDSSIGIQDFGSGTRFEGYTETCRAFNIYAAGKNGKFTVLAGGTTIRSDTASYFAGDTNHIHLASQIDYYNQVPDGANNSLTFQTPQGMETTGTGRITGPNGFDTIARNLQPPINRILNSCNLTAGTWFTAATGAASWSGVATVSSTAMPDAGYLSSTKMVFPGLPGDDAIYIKSYSPFGMLSGLVSFGCFILCESGDVEVMIRAVKGDSTIQNMQLYRARAGTNFQRVCAEFTNSTGSDFATTYQISFRSAAGGTIYVTNCFFLNRVGVKFPPMNSGGVIRQSLPGEDVHGRAFQNGVVINGDVTEGYSPDITGAVTHDSTTNDYATWMLSGGTYNVTIGTGRDGQILHYKRDGSAATINLLLSGTTIDGSGAAIPMNTAWISRKIKYHLDKGWMTI